MAGSSDQSADETGTTADPPEAVPSGIAKLVPIVGWLPRYNRKWLRPDLIAGVSVAALVVPKSLGYAGIVGVSVEHGLYAAAAGAILYAIFGTSRQIATGPSSALAAVAAGALVTSGLSDGDDAVALVAAITMVTGLLYLLLALFKMGWISNFLSKAVITGFLFGAAIQVVIGELPKLTGTEAEGSNSWRELGSWIEGLDQTDGTTLLIGVLSLVLIFGLRFKAPKVPGALVLVVIGIFAGWALDLGDEGVALVGDVPRGLPSVAFPDLGFVRDNIQVIVPASIGLLLIGFSQTAGDAREFASRHRYRIDINQESTAQGAANVGSGLVGGIPVSTSLSASSLNDTSGAKTQVASLTTGAVIVLTLLVLAPLFSDLPMPVLAAIIIEAVVGGMMDVPAMRRLYRVARVDFWIAIVAILGVLGAGVLAGVVIGVMLSLIWLIYVSSTPSMPVLAREPDTQVFRSLELHGEGETEPGVLVVRFDAGLYFASSGAFEDELRELYEAADPKPHTLVISFEAVSFIDSQGSGQLSSVLDLAANRGVQVRLARVHPDVLEVLGKDNVIDQLGEDNIYGNIYRAVMAGEPDATGPTDLG
jgi:SulP family sulfate permease